MGHISLPPVWVTAMFLTYSPWGPGGEIHECGELHDRGTRELDTHTSLYSVSKYIASCCLSTPTRLWLPKLLPLICGSQLRPSGCACFFRFQGNELFCNSGFLLSPRRYIGCQFVSFYIIKTDMMIYKLLCTGIKTGNLYYRYFSCGCFWGDSMFSEFILSKMGLWGKAN